jgi:phage-related protein
VARQPKPVVFRGAWLDNLHGFPAMVRRIAGFQLDRAQHGENPDDWKPMGSIGAGVREIRVRGADGAFRAIYVASLGDAIYVLHCFQKKSQRTSKEDIALATRRYKQLVEELR